MQREVAKWLQSFELSQTVRRGRHELQNGVLIAEILENHSVKSLGTSTRTRDATKSSRRVAATAAHLAASGGSGPSDGNGDESDDANNNNNISGAATRKAALPHFPQTNSKEKKLISAQSLSTGQSMDTLQSNWHVLRPILRKLWKLRSKSAPQALKSGETNCGHHTLVYLDALIYGTMYALEGAGAAMLDELYEILSGAVLAEKHTFDISPNWSPQHSGTAVLERDRIAMGGTQMRTFECEEVSDELTPGSQKLLSWNDKNPPRLLPSSSSPSTGTAHQSLSPARDRTVQRQLAPQYAQPTGSALVHVLSPSPSKVVVPGKGPIFPDEALLQKQSQETLRQHNRLMQQVRNTGAMWGKSTITPGATAPSNSPLLELFMESVAKAVVNAGGSLDDVVPLVGVSGHTYSLEHDGLISSMNFIVKNCTLLTAEESDDDGNAARTFIEYGSFAPSSDNGNVWNALIAEAPMIATLLCASTVLENVDAVRESVPCGVRQEDDDSQSTTHPLKSGDEVHTFLELLSPLFSARTSSSVRLLHVSRTTDVAAMSQSLATTPRKGEYNLDSPAATSPAAAAASSSTAHPDSARNASDERMATTPRKSRIAHRQSVADALLHAFVDDVDENEETDAAEVATSLRRELLLSQNARSASVVAGPRQSCVVGGDGAPAVVVVDHHRAKRWLADADAMHVACAYKFLFSVLRLTAQRFSTFARILTDVAVETADMASDERAAALRRVHRTLTDLFLSKTVQTELIPFLCKDAVSSGTPAIVDGVARLLVCATPRLDGPAAAAAMSPPMWVHLLTWLCSDIPAALHVYGVTHSLDMTADGVVEPSKLSAQRAYHLLCYYALRQIPRPDAHEEMKTATTTTTTATKKKAADGPSVAGGVVAETIRALFDHAVQQALHSQVLREGKQKKQSHSSRTSNNSATQNEERRQARTSAAVAFYETLSLRVLALRVEHGTADDKEIRTCVDDLAAAIATRQQNTSSDNQRDYDSQERTLRAFTLRHWEARIAAIDVLHAYVRRQAPRADSPSMDAPVNSLDGIETALIELLQSFIIMEEEQQQQPSTSMTDADELPLAAQYAMQLVARQLQPDLLPRLAQVWIEQINAHPRTHLAHLLVPLSDYVINERADDDDDDDAMQPARKRKPKNKSEKGRKSGVLDVHDADLLNDLLAAPQIRVADDQSVVKGSTPLEYEDDGDDDDDDESDDGVNEPGFLEYTTRGPVASSGQPSLPLEVANPDKSNAEDENMDVTPVPSVQLLFGLNEPAYAIVPLNQVWDKFTVVRCALLYRSAISVETLISLIAAALLTPSYKKKEEEEKKKMKTKTKKENSRKPVANALTDSAMEAADTEMGGEEEVRIFWRTVAREIRVELLTSILSHDRTSAGEGWVDREETSHAVAAALHHQCTTSSNLNNKNTNTNNPSMSTILEWLKNL